jgi:D-beta-D-heptose 7-phosphate kinase / D-beta-D-heptose 1-phosphate adenosyltransferase
MEFIKRNYDRPAKIAVVGDGMIDADYEVKVGRLNPEGPAPLWQSVSDNPSIRPGGASRVAHLIKNFHADVRYFGIINKELAHVLETNAISSRNSVITECVVPTKKRFYDDGIALARWDVEVPNYGLDRGELEKCRTALQANLLGFDADVVIFSDYGKGVFSEETNWINFAGNALTIVDPKFPPIERWVGCHIFKPNWKEALEISGIDQWQKQCDFYRNYLECSGVVVTNGGFGLYGSAINRHFEYIPRTKRLARSVVGAGDAFSGILALCQAHSIDIIESAEIAWQCANMYVSRSDNSPLTPHDVLAVFGQKRVEPKWLRYRNFNLVFTNGVFDLMHSSHIALLKKARSMGDKLVVAVNSDDSVKQSKGSSRPIQPLEERLKMLESLDFVDYVIPFNEPTPYNQIKEIMPDRIVKGGDWKVEEIAGHDLAPVTLVPYEEGCSTTSLIEKINSFSHDALLACGQTA